MDNKNNNLQELRKKYRKVYQNSSINTTGYSSNLYMQANKQVLEKKVSKTPENYTSDWMVQTK